MLTRRSFLAVAAGAVGVACSGGPDAAPGGPQVTASSASAPGTTSPPSLPPVPVIDGDPFPLGVASGDPLPDRVILWTRIGGVDAEVPAPVEWEVATDERFADVVARGAHVAEPRWGHSVHADAVGLRPDSSFWYRFRVGDHVSPPGRTRTAPAGGDDPRSGRLRLGFGSCQEWTSGHWSAYPHLVDEDLDLMVWLGDYIYESSTERSGAVRSRPGGVARTLDQYRDRYALYTGEEQLRAARAAVPWVVLWDDHEVANDYGGDTDGAGTDPLALRARRAAAYQAWWENQPVRLDPPVEGALRLHRALSWGRRARLLALDERQYRSPAACPEEDSAIGDCAARGAADRSLLGAAQRDWFFGELDRTRARWNVIANEVVMTRLRLLGAYNLDQWDGFAAEQRAVAQRLARPDLNPLVITGDVHAFGVADVKVDYDDRRAPVVATEVVGGSISSAFPLPAAAVSIVRGLDNVKFMDGSRRGYAVVDLGADEARIRLRSVDTVARPTAAVSTLEEFTVEAGRPGAG